MGQFSRTFTVELDVDGDHLIVEMKRLRNEHLLALAPYFVESDDVVKLSFKDKIEMVRAGEKVLPEVVVSFKGLKDANGAELELKDILGEAYFHHVIDTLVGHLFRKSSMKATSSEVGDVKKSDKPSLDAAPAPEAGVAPSEKSEA